MEVEEQVLSIAVIGTGTMGKGIVQVLAQADHIASVIWKGKSLASVQKAFSELEMQWGRMVAKKRLDPEAASRFVRKIHLAEDYGVLGRARCIIEAVPENVVGLHFFNPAPVMKLTEVIAGLTTSPATLGWALDFARQLGKDPVVVNEAPGFIVNRMLIPMINEAIGILAEGVASADEIDKAMRLGANHPIGPLALADLLGK